MFAAEHPSSMGSFVSSRRAFIQIDIFARNGPCNNFARRFPTSIPIDSLIHDRHSHFSKDLDEA